MSRWRPGSRLWGHYWICQLLKHPAINQFTWSSKSSATTWYVQNWTTIIVPNVHINDKSSLVKIMACHRLGKKNYLLNQQWRKSQMQICVTWSQRVNHLLYHDVGEISDLSQSEAPYLVMWRVRVMQPTTPSPWRRGHSWLQFNVQENGCMKYH